MSKAKFTAVKELIGEKKYDEARKLLKTIDHPTAREWETKLNKIEPAAPARKSNGRRVAIIGGIVFVMVIVVYLAGGGAQGVENSRATRTAIAIAAVGTENAAATNIALTPPTATTTPTVTATASPTVTITETATPSPARATAAATLDLVALQITSDAMGKMLVNIVGTSADLENVREATALQLPEGWSITVDVSISNENNTEETMEALRELALLVVEPITQMRVSSFTNGTLQTSWLWENNAWNRVDLATAFDEAEYINFITDGLFIAAGGRNIVSIRVADGRANGGERIIIIGYITTETTAEGYRAEWVDLFSAIAATIRANALDVDSVSLIAGVSADEVVGILSVAVDDLLSFHRGEINQSEFFSRITSETF